MFSILYQYYVSLAVAEAELQGERQQRAAELRTVRQPRTARPVERRRTRIFRRHAPHARSEG